MRTGCLGLVLTAETQTAQRAAERWERVGLRAVIAGGVDMTDDYSSLISCHWAPSPTAPPEEILHSAPSNPRPSGKQGAEKPSKRPQKAALQASFRMTDSGMAAI